MKFKFQAKYLQLLARFIPKSDIRYYLCGFRVEPAPAGFQGVLLVATNGHAAVIIHDALGEILDFNTEKGAYASVKASPGLVTASKMRFPVPLWVTFDSRRVGVSDDYINAESPSVYEAYVQGGDPINSGIYPDIRRIIPDFSKLKSGGLVNGGGVNLDYLSLFKSVEKSRYTSNAITLWHQEDVQQGALFVQIDSMPEALGLVMPMRHGTTEEEMRGRGKVFERKRTSE